MNRNLLTPLTLLAVAGWLLFSYAPQTWGGLPVLAFPIDKMGYLFRPLALIVLLIFLVLQGVLVWATFRLRGPTRANELADGRRLRVGAELFWTALPLLMTVGLALLSYPTWSALVSP